MPRTYEVHYNGARPFFVEVDGTSVIVQQNMSRYDYIADKEIERPPKQLFSGNVDRVFIGKRTPRAFGGTTEYKEYPGNTILLRLKNGTYRYIANEIYDFVPVEGDSIIGYFSDVENSDVPYPVAVGKAHFYFMLDKIAVAREFFSRKKGLYGQFYEASTYLPRDLRTGQLKGEEKEMAKESMSLFKEMSKKMRTKIVKRSVV